MHLFFNFLVSVTLCPLQLLITFLDWQKWNSEKKKTCKKKITMVFFTTYWHLKLVHVKMLLFSLNITMISTSPTTCDFIQLYDVISAHSQSFLPTVQDNISRIK